MIRWLGFLVWAWARPDTLPVPELEAGRASTATVRESVRRLGRLNRILAAAAFCLGVVLFVTAILAEARMREIGDRLIVNRSGESLLSLAGSIESGVEGELWAKLYPDYPARLEIVARAVRSSRDALIEADRARVACAAQLNKMSLPQRLLVGSEQLAPFKRAMSPLTSRLARSSKAYRAMREQLRPYGRSTDSRVLPGRLLSATAGHVFALEVLDADGKAVGGSAAPVVLKIGDAFELPLRAGSYIHMRDLLPSPGGALQLLDEIRFPVVKFPNREITFPKSGAMARLAFDRNEEESAPVLSALPASATAELSPLPPELEGR